MTTTDNIDALALQIYHKHRDAIDLIIRVRSTPEASGWDVLDSTIAQYDPLFTADYHHRNYHRFYAPDLEEIAALGEGGGWTASGRIFLFEVRYNSRALSLIAGPGPQEIRTRLYELAQKPNTVPGVTMRRAQKLSPRYHTLYTKSLMSRGDSSDPDYEKCRPQVEQAFASFFDTDYWPLVNAIRAEFQLPPVPPRHPIPSA